MNKEAIKIENNNYEPSVAQDVTPENKKILIDGGGLENYDIGEKVLIPYLLNKQIKTLDYVMISHFDRDHVRRNNNINPKTKSEKYNNLKTKRRQ